jgi:hypothetical protein
MPVQRGAQLGATQNVTTSMTIVIVAAAQILQRINTARRFCVFIRLTVGTLTKVFVCSCFALYPTFWVISPDVLRLLPSFVRVPADMGAKQTKVLGFP